MKECCEALGAMMNARRPEAALWRAERSVLLFRCRLLLSARAEHCMLNAGATKVLTNGVPRSV